MFIKTYHFVALKQNSSDIEYILVYSLVIGYICCHIAYMIPFSISYEIDILGIIITSVIIAYFLGRFTISPYSIKLFDFLKIRDTGNVYMWDDLMDKDYPMLAIISNDTKKYLGIIHNIESYSNSPHIVLGSYKILDQNDNVITDYSNDFTRIIILDTAQTNNIEIIYDNNSIQCQDIKDLCNYHSSINNP